MITTLYFIDQLFICCGWLDWDVGVWYAAMEERVYKAIVVCQGLCLISSQFIMIMGYEVKEIDTGAIKFS